MVATISPMARKRRMREKSTPWKRRTWCRIARKNARYSTWLARTRTSIRSAQTWRMSWTITMRPNRRRRRRRWHPPSPSLLWCWGKYRETPMVRRQPSWCPWHPSAGTNLYPLPKDLSIGRLTCRPVRSNTSPVTEEYQITLLK